ncbi:MAG TPA: class I SAM-dependent methyltransferase [Gemmatales bacterium]|nr:class I SAM-dependent methyltransferase [Gemmatales bacterium]
MMRSHELDLKHYDSDKVTSGYLEVYDRLFEHLVQQPIKLLEVGIYHGGSMRLWRDYFPNGQIVGVDLNIADNLKSEERIQIFQGSQDDGEFLHRVASQTAPEGFDIIIDDASHLGSLTKQTFWHLFDQHLKPGGLYIIEDWGTGYWEDWPDGKAQQQPSWWSRLLQKLKGSTLKDHWPTHSYGMVGFVKELIDEMGARELTRQQHFGTPLRESKFAKVQLTLGQVIVLKTDE